MREILQLFSDAVKVSGEIVEDGFELIILHMVLD